jgi:hypothetical protein
MSPDDRDGSGEVPAEEREDRPELDVDTAFAAIIAGWGDPVEEGRATWPDAENTAPRRAEDPFGSEPGPDGGAGPDVDPLPRSPAEPRIPPLIPRLGDEPVAEAVEDVEAFVPPDPPPLPRGDLATRLAWAGVAGGPLFLLIAALFWRDLPQLLLMAAVTAFVGGFVTLVLRMPRDRSSSDGDDDDGAVV